MENISQIGYGKKDELDTCHFLISTKGILREVVSLTSSWKWKETTQDFSQSTTN